MLRAVALPTPQMPYDAQVGGHFLDAIRLDFSRVFRGSIICARQPGCSAPARPAAPRERLVADDVAGAPHRVADPARLLR